LLLNSEIYDGVKHAIRLERGAGIKGGWDGMCEGNMAASYTHISLTILNDHHLILLEHSSEHEERVEPHDE